MSCHIHLYNKFTVSCHIHTLIILLVHMRTGHTVVCTLVTLELKVEVKLGLGVAD